MHSLQDVYSTFLEKSKPRALAIFPLLNYTLAMEDIILLLLLGIAVLIGIWGIACLVGGMINSGGPLKLIKNWVKSLGSKEK